MFDLLNNQHEKYFKIISPSAKVQNANCEMRKNLRFSDSVAWDISKLIFAVEICKNKTERKCVMVKIQNGKRKRKQKFYGFLKFFKYLYISFDDMKISNSCLQYIFIYSIYFNTANGPGILKN